MALVDERPAHAPLEKDGLGWKFFPSEAPVTFGFSRIVERSSEITAELHVQTLSNGEETHVLRRRVNLLGTNTPKTLAADLDQATDSAGWPWRKIVESAFASVIEAHREGEKEKLLGGKYVAPEAPKHIIDGLLIANVANTWFGPGGTGKSTAGVAACVAHSLGEPFAGMSVTKGVPLYLDWEDEEEAFERLLWEVSRGYGLDESVRVHWRRMRGTLKDDIAYITALIDRIGATLVVIDSATRAMGSAGEHGTYESTAIAFAEAIRALGKVTTLILDHVDGAAVKEGGVSKKAYGSIHKLNFVRNAWSLTPDEESTTQTVGWTHAKVNHGPKQRPFGVRYERDPVFGGLSLVSLEGAEVAVIAGQMTTRARIAAIVERDGPTPINALALEIIGDDNERACKEIKRELYADHGKTLRQFSDGTVGLSEREKGQRAGAAHLSVVKPAPAPEDDDELPF